MPLPRPGEEENQDEFMARCMSDPKMGEEYGNARQRAAVCYTQWEERESKALSDLKFIPTDSMATEARRGLEWRKEFNRGGTLVGVARANQIISKENLSPSTVKRMFSFFSRHEVDKQGQGFSPGEEGYPSAGRIAWALWGGDAGFSWSRKMRARIDREEGKSLEKHIVGVTETDGSYIIEFAKDEEDHSREMDLDLAFDGLSSYEYNFILDIFGDAILEAEEKAPRGEVTEAIRKGLQAKAKEHNDKYGDTASKRTSTRTLVSVFKRGVGAYYTNPQSVRPNVQSPEQWGLGRVNSFLYALRTGKYRSGKHDTDLLPEEHPMSSKNVDDMNTKIFNITSTFKSYHEDEDDGSIKIRGYASTVDTDRSGDIIESSAWKKGGLDNYQKNPILLFNHDYNKPIGKATSLTITSRGLEIEGKISKSAGHIAEMVKEGILSAFSVGFRVKDADWMDETEGYRIKDAELFEVSVVSVPANQGAIFSVTKSFDSEKDYSDWKAQFVNDPHLLSGQFDKNSPKETAHAVFKEKVMSQQDFNIEEFAREVARKTAAEIQMQAAEKAAAEKAIAEEAAVKKASEEAELEQKKAEVQAVVQGVTTGAERLMSDLEKRVSTQQEDLYKVVEELRNELKEKSSEIEHIRESKRIFTDRGNKDWQKAFEQDAYDAYFLGRATGKGYDTRFARDLMEKVNAHSGVGVSSADFEQVVSTNVERDIQLELTLAPLFREIQMRSATQILPIMPDSGYAEFTSNQTASGSSPHGNLNERSDTYGSYNGVDMTERTLSTKKLISQSYLGNETEEDAIIPILPLLREAVVRAHARAVEAMILVGNAADGPFGTGGAAPAGLIALAGSDSHKTQSATAFASESLTAANLLAARKNMGKYGIRPSDVVYIVSPTEYHNLIADSAYADASQVEGLATKLTGEVGRVYGSPVIVSPEFATAAVSKYYAVAVNARNFVVPRLRGVTIESDYEVANQRRVLVASQRLGFTDIIDGATSKWALQYKAS